MSAGSTFIPGAHAAQSKEIDSINGVIKSASLYVNQFVPVDTNIVYFMSADGGSHWEAVIPGDLHTFTFTGDDLRWRAVFLGPQYRSAYLYYVEIDYTFNEAPSVPSINSLGGAKFTGIFKLSWSAATDDVEVDHYQLQMSDSSSFSTILKSWNTSQTTQKITNFGKGPLYFRVRAVDNEGVASVWSTTESVNIKLAASILTIIIVGAVALLLIIVVVFVIIISKKKKNVKIR